MRNQKARLFCSLVVLTFIVGLLTGCKGSTTPTTPVTNPQETAAVVAPTTAAETKTPVKDTLVIAMINEPTSLSPYDHNAIYSDYMNQMTYNGLFRLDENATPIPDLVQSYKQLSDTEWTFTIFDGVKFHDGTTMTSADVKASLEYAKTFPAVKPYTQSYATVDIVDNLTVKVTTNGPSATLLYDLANHGNYITPKALIDSGNNFKENPIGSGPYKFVKWTLGDKIEFTKFADYFDTTAMPTITDVTWKFIPEGSSRTIGLQTGEIDLIIEVATNDIATLKADSSVVVLEHPALQLNWLFINNEKAPFDNLLVRKAINAAIDRDSVITVALNGVGQAAISQTPFGMLGSTEVNAEGYDVTKAKQYLTDSGVDPASIKLDMICSNSTKKSAAEVIQANLAEIGITNVTVTSMDLATYLSATSTGDFTGAIGGYLSSNMVAYLQGTFISTSIGGSNRTRFNNSEVDAMIKQAAATVDPVAREQILKNCTELLNTLVPLVPLYQDKYVRAYNADLGGVAINAAGNLRINALFWK